MLLHDEGPASTLTAAEAAARLGVSVKTLYRWVADRKIRHIKLPSGQVRFLEDDIDEILTPVEAVEAAS